MTINLTTLVNPAAQATVAIQNSGTQLTSGATSVNFTGSGVTATNSGAAVTVTIEGTSLGGIDGGAASTPVSSYSLRMDFGGAT